MIDFLFTDVGWASHKDDTAEILFQYNLLDIPQCIKFIDVYLRPIFQIRSDNFRLQIKLALLYIIKTGKYDYDRMQASSGYQVELPSDAKWFSQMMLKELCGIDYEEVDFNEYDIRKS